MMTDDFKLRDRAKKWITAIRKEFKAEVDEALPEEEKRAMEIGGFKMT